MNNITTINDKSVKASEIIRKKLLDCGGKVTVFTLDRKPCNIVASSDGLSFTTDKIMNYSLAYKFSVFDFIVDLLCEQGGKAKRETLMEKRTKSEWVNAPRIPSSKR